MSFMRAQPPLLGAPAAPRLPPAQRHFLRNGLEVLLVERRDLPVLDAQLVVRAGAFDDDAMHAGRAYLTADLLDQGTTTHSATQIADAAELLGASLQTRGSWDFCTAALHVLTPRLEPALALLADVATRPTFPEAECARKRAQRLAAIMQEADEPRLIANHALARVVYGPAHPYGLPLGGTRETVQRISAADLRDFYGTRFTPASAFLIVVGDIAPDALLPLLEEQFGGWTGAAPGARHAHDDVTATRRAVHIVDLPGAPQSEVRVGCPGPERTTLDYFPLLVANTILGGAFTSRLNMRLREEKAYTYGAGSSFAWRRGGGPFLASTAVFTGATADAVLEIVRETARMANEPVSPAELERAHNFIVLGLPRTFETTADIAEHVSEIALYGLGDSYYDDYAAHVRAVTPADVQAAAARWLTVDQLSIVIAGDATAIATDLAALDLGTVTVSKDG